MFLTYLDDSGTRQKERTFQLITAVLISDSEFFDIERHMGAAVEQLLPEDRIEKFEEFHAWELYGGFGVFEGIDQDVRFDAIKRLLSMVAQHQLPVVYGAVNTKLLADKLYASANPVDIAFRICAQGISKWMGEHATSQRGNELALLIADDTDDKKLKAELKRSFRQMGRQTLEANPKPVTRP